MIHGNAVKALQIYLNTLGAGLTVDGWFGAKTTDAINTLNLPKYVKIALKEVGVHETAGAGNTARVVEYLKTTAGKYSEDAIPWCGAFVNWCLLKSGESITVPYPERARSWDLYGNEIDEPTLGAIAVKSRKGGGHVCFVIGADVYGNLLCLGGNQSDEVNIRAYRVDAFHTFRLPIGQHELSLGEFNLNADNATKEA